jgi:hypothetical protein
MEEYDVAADHPDVVQRIGMQHEEWSKTLAPLGEIPKIRAGQPIIPTGHGWAIAKDGK